MIIVIIIIIISLMRHDKAGRSQAITNDCRLATSTNAHNVKLVSILSTGGAVLNSGTKSESNDV